MHIFGVAFIVSGILFALFQKQTLILYFLFTIAVYVAISAFVTNGKSLPNRKKIMLSTWSHPSEGVISVKVPCRTEKIQEIIKKSSGQDKLTMTHFVIKALGNLISSSSEINGILTFGKFVPYKTTDVSCLVDIQGGKDLALILVEQLQKKSVKDIAKFIRQKGSKLKSGKGDKQHKQRTKAADYFPAFLVGVLIQVASFVSNRLGISVPALALKKHQFGAGCVTSLGMLGFQDATAPFTGFMDNVMIVSANAIHQQAVVNNGKIQIGRVMNCNFAVDHRYIDGGKAKKFVSTFGKIFENPQAYIDSPGPVQDMKKEV